MSNADEVIAEAERVLQGARASINDDRKRQHIQCLPAIAKHMLDLLADDSTKSEKKVHMAYLVPDSTLNTSASSEFVDDAKVKSNPEDFISAKLVPFYSFGDIKEATSCFVVKSAGIVACELNPEDAGAILYIKARKYGIAAMVAANCLTVSRIVNGEATTEHVDLAQNNNEGDPERFFAKVKCTSAEQDTIKALIEFHTAPRMLKASMPNTYQTLLAEIHKQAGLDEEEED